MKGNFLCPCVLLLSLVDVSNASDLRLDNTSVYDWNGVYLGATAGYGSGKSGNSWINSMFFPVWQPDGDIEYRSWLGGIQLGVLHQIDRWVVGLEADYNVARFSGDDSRFAGEVNALEIDHYGTARARLGWSNDRSLFYATGGVAYGEITKKDLSLTYDTTNASVVGWAAGAGYEHAFGENWLARLEYQHVDLGDAETQLESGIGGYTHRAEGIRFDVVRVGLSYKF